MNLLMSTRCLLIGSISLLFLTGCATWPSLPKADNDATLATSAEPPGTAEPTVPTASSVPATPAITAESPERVATPDTPVVADPPVAAASAASSTSPSGAAADGIAQPQPDDESLATGATGPLPVDPLRPDVRLNPNEFEIRTDLWDRLRRGFSMPDLDTDLTRDREHWYASRPDYFSRMTERGSRYLFHIIEEVERRQLPSELALLPFIESAFNPQALSSAKASGIWQFMPATGRHFDLKQNVFRDDRRDVLASTRAALDYLQKLHGMFGDWHLALAAYNWGEGSVSRAVARNRKAGLPTDYTSLKMPRETQYYVPKFQAVKNLIARPQAHGLTLPAVENHPYFLSVSIDRDIDVALAARLSGMTLEDFQDLNPQMNKPVILAAGTPQVLLPYDNANQFVRQLPLHRGPLSSWTAWVAPRTLRPADAARQVGMSEEQLREVNRIPPRMLVQAGSTLLVPRSRHAQADVSGHIADHAMISLAPDGPPLRKLSLKAGRNDSVASVAKRYRVSAAQVGSWNGVGASARFKAGQTIVVFVAGKAAGKTTVAKSSRKSAKAVATAKKPAGKPNKSRVASTKSTVRVAKH